MKRLRSSSSSDTSDNESESRLRELEAVSFCSPAARFFFIFLFTHFVLQSGPSTSFCSSHKYGGGKPEAPASNQKKPAEVSPPPPCPTSLQS